MTKKRLAAVAAVMLCLAAQPQGAETWVEVDTPNFRIVSNAGESAARQLAWQFEQIRAGIARGWPWADVALDRPLLIVGVKDENSLKPFAPQYWEQSKDPQLASVSASAWDRHYIVVRTDARVDGGEGVNPYRSAYWTYVDTMLSSSFRYRLPMWFERGMAAVLSNTNVTNKEIQFGRAVPSYMAEMQGGRFTLAELLAADRTSPAFREPLLRRRFDAQAWGLTHFLLFGSGDAGAREDRINTLAQQLMAGRPSADAVQAIYGPLAELDTAYRRYIDRGLTRFVTMSADVNVSAKAFAARPIDTADVQVIRAAFLAANNRAAEARAVLAAVRAGGADRADTYDVEGMLLEREQQRDAAIAAYQRAADLGSASFMTYARLATLAPRDAMAAADRKALFDKAIAANERYAPAYQQLSSVLMELRQPDEALTAMARAVALGPTQVPARVSYASMLLRAGRTEDARREATAALALASTDAERAMAQRVIDQIR